MKKRKNGKGSVAIVTRYDRLYLRFRPAPGAKQVCFCTGLPDNPCNRAIVGKTASEIAYDLAHNCFDASLAKYRDQPAERKTYTTPELWQLFIGDKTSVHYTAMRSNLTRFGEPITDEPTARQFIDHLAQRQSPRTLNENLRLLQRFGAWAVKEGHLTANPFEGIAPQKAPRRTPRQPFTRDEVTRILTAAKFHPLYSTYHDFIFTLIHLGLRPSEAIGLQWRHIDLERGEVTISESLSRSPDGRGGNGARVRKETKTGSVRTLSLTPSMLAMLQGRKSSDTSPDNLVFTTPSGGAIDDHVFSQRVWKSICERAGVAYRPPYNCRHTLLSHLIEDGGSLIQAAAVAGHADATMVASVYGHMINRPKMPEF